MTIEVEAFERKQFQDSTLLPDWPAPSQVRAFTTLRGPAGNSEAPFHNLNLGARGGGDLVAVIRNRTQLSSFLELPSTPHWLQQVHSTHVATFARRAAHLVFRNDSNPEHFAELVRAEPIADAAVTTTAGVVLAILTADCLPVLFASDNGSAIGAAHAGWRGLAAGVLENTVAAMRAAPEKILAWLGPAAGPQAYEVGDEVRAAFVDVDSRAASAFVATRPGHWLCDLYALARLRLTNVGVTRVHGGGLSTISDSQRFFSYRRDGRTGRMASLIWIE